jgi:hypothetical protein
MSSQSVSDRKEPNACPESTIESAPRRNFLRKAAITTAVAGMGGTLIARNLIPTSAISSSSNSPVVGCNSAASGAAVKGTETGSHGYGVYGCSTNCGTGVYGEGKVGVEGHSESCTGVIGSSCGFVGVCGYAIYCAGVRGCSPCGAGVLALAGTSGVPLIARGPFSALSGSHIQEWQTQSLCKATCKVVSTSVSVVNKCGWLGIGTSSPSTPLNVVGSTPLIGTIKSGATSGDRSSLVQFANGDSTPVDWNVGVAGLCNSIKVPDGYFYVQHSTSTTPAISVNKCNNHVGIGIANPCRVLCVNGRIHTQCGMGLGTQTINTTLAINGSVSMKSRQVSAAVTLTLSDYAVLANASSAAFTITLPAVSSTAGACNGMILFIKKIDSSANQLTVAASGTDTIEGNASVVLKKQFDSLELISNNSNSGHEWFILSGVKCGAVLS